MARKSYATDLMGAEGDLAEPYVRTSRYSRPPLHSKRKLLNAILLAGRKRHIVVDTLGLPLAVLVPAASVQNW